MGCEVGSDPHKDSCVTARLPELSRCSVETFAALAVNKKPLH